MSFRRLLLACGFVEKSSPTDWRVAGAPLLVGFDLARGDAVTFLIPIPVSPPPEAGCLPGGVSGPTSSRGRALSGVFRNPQERTLNWNV